MKQSAESKTAIKVLEEQMRQNNEAHEDIRCDIKDVKDDIKHISEKLDTFADKKADKKDLNKIWSWILGIIATLITGMFFFIINKI